MGLYEGESKRPENQRNLAQSIKLTGIWPQPPLWRANLKDAANRNKRKTN